MERGLQAFEGTWALTLRAVAILTWRVLNRVDMICLLSWKKDNSGFCAEKGLIRDNVYSPLSTASGLEEGFIQ